VVPLQHDLEKLDHVVSEQSKQIYRDATVPLVVGFQDEQNRATAESSLQQWYDGPLQFKRSHLNNVMWMQWYKPILEKMFEDSNLQSLAETGELMDYVTNKAAGATEKIQLQFKVRMQFTNIRAAGILDLGQIMLSFREAGLLNDDMTRTETQLGQYNTQMHEEAMAKQQARNNMMSTALALQGNPTTPTDVKLPEGSSIVPTEMVKKEKPQLPFGQ
jgi:hypothetical protein